MGAVLAGGASSRMGTDKAFIEMAGEPMVLRAVDALRAAGAEPTLVVGGDAARLAALGLDNVPDRYPGQGPLGAVITALETLEASPSGGVEAMVTLPCDVVEPDTDAVRHVLDALAATDLSATDVVVPLGGGAPQWLHAAWRRECLHRLSEVFARGFRAPRDAVSELRTITVEVPGTGWFRDADRPEDLPAGVRLRPA